MIKLIAPMLLVLLAGANGCANQEPPRSASATVEGPEDLASPPSLAENSETPHASTAMPPTTAAAVDVLASPHSHLLALSADEARWLERHGYPTAAELEALPTFDVEELEMALRNRKDIKAGALLGHRRLLDGDLPGASSAFAAAANFGSLYARQQLAMTSTMDVTNLPRERLSEADQGNLAVMISQLEVARLLGDHRAQAYIDRYGSEFDWKRYGRHVLNQTAEFMRQYGEFAHAVGRPSIGPDPRPNADLWNDLKTDPNAMVTVYDRAPEGG